MKKVILVLAVILVCQLGFAQEVKSESPNAEDNLIYNTAGIEVKPDFPGGLQEFYKFIGKNYKTPNVKNLKGKVFVMFVIEKDGSLTDIKVLRDIGHGTGEEAVRVLKECPKWLPGEQNGQKVRVLYSLPISIQLP
jgi:protein TonB